MAHATELTITTGRTHHSGDLRSDEPILSREARVSVTWRLGEDEHDLTLMASVLGEEAERALDAACRAAKGRREELCQEEPCGWKTTPSPSADGAATDGAATDGAATNGAATNGAATNGTAVTAPPSQPPHSSNGNHGSVSKGNGSAAYCHGRTAAAPNASGSHTPGSTRAASKGKRSAVTAPPAVPLPPPGEDTVAPQQITAPQRLAIRALCHRLEVQEMDLKLLLDERFGKQGIEALSKEEAGALLVALQRGEWEEADQPAFAN